MPFRSAAQRRYMFAMHPAIAMEWVSKYGAGIKKGKARKLTKK